MSKKATGTSEFQVTYFIEYPPENVSLEKRGLLIKSLLDEKTLDHLAKSRSRISLAMITLDEDTAEVIRTLNNKGIPIVAWITVEDNLGYWANLANVHATIEKTRRVLEWADEKTLQFSSVAFDIEKPLYYLTPFFRFDIFGLIRARRRYKKEIQAETKTFGNPASNFQKFVEKLKSKGITTEAYTAPKQASFLGGELESTNFDRTIKMLYTTALPKLLRKGPIGNLLRDKAMADTKEYIPAFGIISAKNDKIPGRNLNPKSKPVHLTAEELAVDIRHYLKIHSKQSRHTSTDRPTEIYIFALNGEKSITTVEEALSMLI